MGTCPCPTASGSFGAQVQCLDPSTANDSCVFLSTAMMLPLLFVTALGVNIAGAREVPAQALVVDWKSFVALEMVEAVSVQNFTTVSSSLDAMAHTDC